MNTSTRLILILTVSVSAVMALASFLTLREWESSLESAAEDEIRAHAKTLQIALEEDFRTGRTLDAQKLIDRLGQNEGIYGVLLFDEMGEIKMVSNTLKALEISDVEEAKTVIATGKNIEHQRKLSNEEVFSIILPLRADNKIVGAMEIAQPISFVEAFINRGRRQKIITTLLLCLVIFLVVLSVTRYTLTQHINELLGGAEALGRGDLNYRVPVPQSGGELGRLAKEFNRMADHLSEQRAAAASEAKKKLELERELRHSERLASVGRLAAGVAHEMGAPLQVIDGRAKQLLNNDDAPPELKQRNLTIIRAQSERIAQIVRQLLTLARPYNLHMREIKIGPLINGTLELLETDALQANVRFETAIDEDFSLRGDPELLHQVFLNIFFNAIQAMPDGGVLRVEFKCNAGRRNEADFFAMKISDTGPGIAEENLPHVFDPFFTTKEVGSGTGLGLAVSSRIIEEHGGWIEAANDPQGGALFTVFLPQTGLVKSALPALAGAVKFGKEE